MCLNDSSSGDCFLFVGFASLFSIWTPVLSNHIQHAFVTFMTLLREGTLENLWGGGSEVQKKNSRKGKLNEKNSCTPINPKKYSCYGLKKIIQGI